jgi:hypothetical protein
LKGEIKMDWIINNKNRKQLEKLQEKRSMLIIDVTINDKYRNTYQERLNRINKEIEKVYYDGKVRY